MNRILNCIPSRNTELDWTARDAAESGMLLAFGQLPESVDLREDWWAIGDQGASGSCVGWGAADSVIRWHMVKTERLAPHELLSVRYIWMAAKETDQFTARPTSFIESEGTSLKAALDIARKYGVVLDSDLPFTQNVLYQGNTNTFYALAAKLKINAYFNLHTNTREWCTWLANNGPILIATNIDETWDNATDNRGHLDVYKPDTTRGGHAIALVGYTPNYLIVRNSWGTGWGDNGFAYASYDYASRAFMEAYGVTLA